MALRTRSLHVYVFCFFMLWALLYSTCQQAHGQAIPGGISDTDFNALLTDLRGGNFFTGAAVLSYFARPYLQPHVTLLIPTDHALVQAVDFSPKDYPNLIKFHILQKNFNFKQLRLLPVGTWIPTALPGFGVQVTSNSVANLSLGTAQLISPNLCPSLVSSFITCQGISAILNPKASNPPVFAGAPTSNVPSPSISLPPTFPPSNSPSLSPSSSSPSPSIPPSTSTSPSTSPSPSTPPSPSTTPPTASSPSPLITPLPLAPSPSTSPSLSPASSATPPSFINTNPEGFAPGPAPSAAASVSMVGAYLLSSIGAYVLVLSHFI